MSPPDPMATYYPTRLRAILLGGGVLLSVVALLRCCFIVDVTEYGIVSRFGQIVRVIPQPGLRLKWPFDSVIRLDKRIGYAQPAQAEFLTMDKKNIVADTLATWRIADPKLFLETVQYRSAANQQLEEALVAKMGALLGRYSAASLISATGEARGYRGLVAEAQAALAGAAGAPYGIELIDVDIRRLSLPEQNRDHVFERMKAERGRIAKKYRSEGELEAKKIIAQADRERTLIESEAQAQAQRLKAEGDAQAARIYHTAFTQDPRFYKFLRTLQAYEKFLDENTTLFIPAEAEVLEMLRPQLQRASDKSPHVAPAARYPRTDERRSVGLSPQLLHRQSSQLQ